MSDIVKPHNGKLIREGRMGSPKSFKTGAVCGTYPRPLLCMQFDEGGMDVLKEKVKIVTPEEFSKDLWCKKETKDLPPIMAINFAQKKANLTDSYDVKKEASQWQGFAKCVNEIHVAGCPWATIVLDPLTELSECILRHMAQMNSGAMADPRKWAASAGAKVSEVVGSMTGYSCHVVFLMHSQLIKDEQLSGEISIQPMLYSRYREVIAAQLSQFFYAEIKGGKATVLTQPSGYVKGIGARWPADLPASCGATYKDIYETVHPERKS